MTSHGEFVTIRNLFKSRRGCTNNYLEKTVDLALFLLGLSEGNGEIVKECTFAWMPFSVWKKA